jgi:hypothetical protein
MRNRGKNGGKIINKPDRIGARERWGRGDVWLKSCDELRSAAVRKGGREGGRERERERCIKIN